MGVGQGDAPLGLRVAEPAQACGGIVIAQPAADEMERAGPAQIARAAVEEQAGQIARADIVVGDDRRREGSRQVEIDRPDAGGPAERGDPVGIGGAGGDQAFGLVGDQFLRRLDLQLGLALGAGDHGEKAAGARQRLELFGDRAEIAVVVLWHDHPDDVRLLAPQDACLDVRRIAFGRRDPGDLVGKLLADSALAPRSVEDRTDRAGGSLGQPRNVIDRWSS